MKSSTSLRSTYLQFFSEGMIKCFAKKGEWKTIRNFSVEDICLALTIRGFCKKTYNYLRDNKLLPLPCESTLQKHVKDFKLVPGILEPMVRLLEIWATRLTDVQKIVGLTFDEVHLVHTIAYNAQQDQFFGPFGKVNVMLVQSFF